jgi:hypothetical protein
MHVRFAEIANIELVDVCDWYEQQQPGLGLRFKNAVRDAAIRIARTPSAVSAGVVKAGWLRLFLWLCGVAAYTDGSRGFAGLSQAACHLRVDDLHTSASLYPAISEKDLLGLPIPNIPTPVQSQVAAWFSKVSPSKPKANACLKPPNAL